MDHAQYSSNSMLEQREKMQFGYKDFSLGDILHFKDF